MNESRQESQIKIDSKVMKWSYKHLKMGKRTQNRRLCHKQSSCLCLNENWKSKCELHSKSTMVYSGFWNNFRNRRLLSYEMYPTVLRRKCVCVRGIGEDSNQNGGMRLGIHNLGLAIWFPFRVCLDPWIGSINATTVLL